MLHNTKLKTVTDSDEKLLRTLPFLIVGGFDQNTPGENYGGAGYF